MTICSRRPDPLPGSRRWERIAAALHHGDDAAIARRLSVARAHVALVRAAVAPRGCAAPALPLANSPVPAAAEPEETPLVEVLPAPDLRQPWQRAICAYLVLIAREGDELERYLLRCKLLRAIHAPHRQGKS